MANENEMKIGAAAGPFVTGSPVKTPVDVRGLSASGKKARAAERRLTDDQAAELIYEMEK